jgi:hypothetical protein
MELSLADALCEDSVAILYTYVMNPSSDLWK